MGLAVLCLSPGAVVITRSVNISNCAVSGNGKNYQTYYCYMFKWSGDQCNDLFFFSSKLQVHLRPPLKNCLFGALLLLAAAAADDFKSYFQNL